MKHKSQSFSGNAKSDNVFFLAILSVLIGCTLFSGGAAIILAREMLNGAAVNIAQVP
jgi:hypothetical protein